MTYYLTEVSANKKTVSRTRSVLDPFNLNPDKNLNPDPICFLTLLGINLTLFFKMLNRQKKSTERYTGIFPMGQAFLNHLSKMF